MYYIPSRSSPISVSLSETKPGSKFRYIGRPRSIRGPDRFPLTKPPYTRVSAVNLNTGVYEWVVANGDGMRQRIIDQGIPDPGPVGAFGFTGPLLTRSLLFIAVNDNGPLLRAFDKQTGVIVHETKLPLSPSGTPMSYMVDGRQYISVTVGGGKNAKLVTLALR
jgi:quinoprotein glucose dehydrogenase